ncbi:hypothetical protein DTO271G3_6560 [Paecilomyces variotii]|nr:hypothetical protein DTO271G3_6560 [Paecilomyces variotii]
MRSSIVLLATLATYALALPTNLSFDRKGVQLTNVVADVVADIEADLTPFVNGLLGIHTVTGLGAKGAAALEGCALGLKAGLFDAGAKAQLHAWLNGSSAVFFDASLKTAVMDWCTGEDSVTVSVDVVAGLSMYVPATAQVAAQGGLTITLDGVVTAADVKKQAVIDVSAQASLAAFLSSAVGLDAKVKAGLHLGAAGGLSLGLSADVKAALQAYVSSDDCALSVELKTTVLNWLTGTIEGAVVAIEDLVETALSSLSVGASISAHVQAGGALSVAAQASLGAFLSADVSAKLDAGIKASLQAAVQGGLAEALSVDARVALTAWLASVDCQLTAELKGILLFWLNIGSDVDSVVTLAVDEISKITAFLESTVGTSLSAVLRGAIAVAAAGEDALSLSADAVAELSALLSGAVNIDIDLDVKIALINWTTRTYTSKITSITGTATSVSALPSASAVKVPTASMVSNVKPVPSVSAPAVNVPSASTIVPNVPVESVPAVSGVPSASVPTLKSVDSSVPSSVPSLPNATSTPSIPVSGSTSTSSSTVSESSSAIYRVGKTVVDSSETESSTTSCTCKQQAN